jgi:hypothetical protein
LFYNQGDVITISVTVKNQGNSHDSASFDVRVLWDSTQIDMKSISELSEGSEETLDFTWDKQTHKQYFLIDKAVKE